MKPFIQKLLSNCRPFENGRINLLFPQYILLHSQSIGHFINDTEIMFAKHKDARKLGIRFRYYTQEKISNQFWRDLLSSEVSLGNRKIAGFLHRVFRNLIPGYSSVNQEFSRVDLQDILKFRIHETQSRVMFNEDQIESGKRFLRRLGVRDAQEIAVITVRDQGYDQQYGNQAVREQSYRNTPLNDLVPLVEFLIENGYYVIRMGRHNSQRIPVRSDNFADFSDRSSDVADWMDFYIFSCTSFVLSTASGIDHIGIALRKRVYTFNFAPVGTMNPSYLSPFNLASDYVDRISGEKIQFSEIVRRSIENVSSSDYFNQGSFIIKGKDASLIYEFAALALKAEELYKSLNYYDASEEIKKRLINWSKLRGLTIFNNTLY